MKRILFISGSLRKESFNRQLLEMAAQRLLSDFECTFLDYSDLPLLNQDEEFPAPAAVQRIRSLVASADALWIGSPEYNHSYSAALKNLIDWLSRPVEPGDYSSAVGRGKLVAVSSVAGSSGGSFSIEKLVELMEMLGCTVMPERTMIPLGSRFGQRNLVMSAEERQMLVMECEALKSLLET